MHGEMTSWVFEDSFVLRSVNHDGDPAWFAGPDLARALGYRDATDALRGLDDDERGTHNIRTPTGTQAITVVSEPGLYRCVLQRRDVKRLPEDVRGRIMRFQRWVFHEVLPAIRKTGRYEMPRAEPEPVIVASRPFDEWTPAELNSKIGAVAEYRMSIGPHAGRWALQRFGLPMPPDSVMRGRQYELDLRPNP